MKDLQSFFWLVKINKGQNWRVFCLALIQILLALLGVAFAVMTSRVVDAAISGGLAAAFWSNAIGLAILGAIQIFLTFLNRHLHVDVVSGIDIHMKRMLFSSLLKKDFSSVSKYHSGVLMSRINEDVKMIADGMADILPGVLGTVVRLIAAFGAMCFIDIRFAFVFLAVGIVAMFFAMLLRGKMKQMHRNEQEKTEQSSSFMQESVGNLLMLKTFGVEGIINERASRMLQERKKAINRRKSYGAFMNLLMNTAYRGGYILGLVWCAVKIARGTISVGMFSAVLQLTGQIERPLATISGYIPRIATVLTSAERIRELLDLPDEDLQNCVDRSCYENMQEIRAEGISFSYDRDVVLDQADFTLKKGEFAVLSGTSGIGKSTLMKLMLGVYAPAAGELYLESDGKIALGASTRSLFAYVPQGNFLLSGTLHENICMMCRDATQEQITEALKISDAFDFVSALPDGLDTVVGERGIGLSEGQLQRLAIARALLSEAPILLMDESTSALDEPTEARVLSNLQKMTDKTCLLISHKKAALDVCDSVYTIKDGKIYKS